MFSLLLLEWQSSFLNCVGQAIYIGHRFNEKLGNARLCLV
jgi:hypothetical protein